MVTWRQLTAEATEQLARADVPDPELSARHIGQRATGTDGAEWIELLDQHATQRHVAAFDAMVARRQAGEPLQYVIGRWGFRHLDLFIDRRVLIPRPETEIVAGQAISEVRRLTAAAPRVTVVDLGTGSGAIGLSIAMETDASDVWLTDRSADAAAVARANIVGIGRAGSRVRVAEGDWFDALPPWLRGEVGVIVSNPPYVAEGDEVDPQVAWEPRGALFAPDTTSFHSIPATGHLEHLIAVGPEWLVDEGALVLEMAPDQIDAMAEWAGARFAAIQKIKDLTGRGRAIVARFPLRS
ncbi:MAG: peptide chain release factor N(5)-glutamine methyltransferase [Acidimicrobiia bacterium]|nr:peptide chain release factor N(5)-glutamine methyltransferase [Acidimicrobiia bacterium]